MKSMKKIILIGIILVSVLAVTWAGGGATETPTGQAQMRPINFALQGSPDTLDPHKTSGTLTFQVVKSFYDTLVEPDRDGNIVPALAESWTVSPDGMTWTFKLRQGVKFHNGDSFTSADVKATFDRIMDPATAAPKLPEYANITSVTASDAYTVVLQLGAPVAPLLATLASGWSAILPASLIQSGHDFASKPVGTGPFTLQEWVRDGRIVLKKNPNYWMAGLPKVETVNYQIIPEQSVGIQGVQSGQLDIIVNVIADEIPTLEANPNVTVEKTASAMILVLAMNTSNPGLSDLRLRQAVNHAIDKQLVLDVVYGGGVPTATFLDPTNAYYKEFSHLYPYNPDRAKTLVNQVGAPAKREFTMVLPQNYEMHVQAGEVYQEMLSKIGLNIKIQMTDWPTWNTDVYRGGKFDFTVIGHTGKLDPDGTLGGYGDPARYVRWTNQQCLDLVNKAKVTTDTAQRKVLYDQILEIMAREAPFMYLGCPYIYNAYRSDVHDFVMTPKLDTFDFRWLDIK